VWVRSGQQVVKQQRIHLEDLVLMGTRTLIDQFIESCEIAVCLISMTGNTNASETTLKNMMVLSPQIA